jgi:diguanylate cyclase (GGDEF)-like protein
LRFRPARAGFPLRTNPCEEIFVSAKESRTVSITTHDHGRPGHRAGPDPARRYRHDRLVAVHPDVTAALVFVAGLLALVTPAVLATAVMLHLTMLGLAGSAASLVLYGGGYLAAVWHRRHLLRDPVTGLPTRLVAEAALHAATTRGTRLTVALADVDGLRAVNNGIGHAAGDQLLAAVAARLARAVPPGGLAARLGGDEFILIAPDTDPAALATAVGAALAGPATIAGHRMQPRASVGIASTHGPVNGAVDGAVEGIAAGPVEGPVDAHHALARADAAMYTAKGAAGNQILVFDPERDGEPNRDGTRPLLRRRDQRPAATDAINRATARPGDQLVPVLWTGADITTIHTAVAAARDRFAEAAALADTGAGRPDRPAEPAEPHRDGLIDVEPTRRGYADMAALLGTEAAKYHRLAQQLSALAVTVDTDDDL